MLFSPCTTSGGSHENFFRTVLFALIVGLTTQAGAQGSFQNLNFEQTALYVTPTPVDNWGDFFYPPLAFPGWTASQNTVGF